MQERGVLLSRVSPPGPCRRDVVAHLRPPSGRCDAAPLIANARRHGWPLDPAKVALPRADRVGPGGPACCRGRASAARYRRSLHAEWVELDGVGHAPQLEVPLETAQLIVGFTAM